VLKWLVALCSGAAGVGVAILDIAWGLSTIAPQDKGPPGQPSFEEQRLLFEACITFYGAAYFTGRLLYGWLGAHAEAEIVQEQSKGHMALLHFIGGCWLVGGGVASLVQAGSLRPGLFVGAVLIAMALRDAKAGLQFAGVGQTILWRGRGLLALIMALLPIASCAGLLPWHPAAGAISGVLLLLGGGFACVRLGRRWRQQQNATHPLLGIPLEVWGWIYLVSGGLCGLLAVAGLVTKAVLE
jgi:hypothetical protein